MADLTLKARVFTETTPAGLGWTYEIYDPAKPDGNQLTISGMRPSWSAALDAACQYLARAEQTRRMILKLLTPPSSCAMR